MNYSRTLGLIFIAIAFIACSESNSRKTEEKEVKEDFKAEAEAPLREHLKKVYYPIPSPEQMFSFINENGINYSSELTNPVSNAKELVQPSLQALNFGIYTADLAYAAAYKDVESTIKLYQVVKELGTEMNIAEIVTDEMMSRMQQNMENPDSLAQIAGNSYYQAVEFLEQNGQEEKLALMSLGGWVESIYITINTIEKFDSESKAVQRIADQKIIFGNLFAYLKKYEDKASVNKALGEIKEIRNIFSSLKESRFASTSNTKKNGKMVLEGGSRVKITEAQFDALKLAINNYRASIISATV